MGLSLGVSLVSASSFSCLSNELSPRRLTATRHRMVLATTSTRPSRPSLSAPQRNGLTR
ncbi:hypothetical protein PF010_g30245 [Phytophthora fragariae]|uniref:Uncharacterized protein n=1 Tax=Phytophthora fragariae TaxID=53985 RepID=A0A6A3GXB3_9STRA|nr:hypothetical protein PF011_g29710 [Phytophthora fragariae]KAE9060368.1 hypothetical protein PF010_g30245 [Phytophthora fragariae]KAE9164653.1 hypothetical protein PF004_g29757 [Phytophthora fragariae]